MNPTWVAEVDRSALDDVEPFDEWEEFILFASHYFLLVATKSPSNGSPAFQRLLGQELTHSEIPVATQDGLQFVAQSSSILQTNVRRFGALVPLHSGCMGHIGGLGAQSRLNGMDLFGPHGSEVPIVQNAPGLKARMCHTVTPIGDGSSLLIGGRMSPDKPLKDCWLFHETWRNVHDLPMPLFRHCAAPISLPGTNCYKPGVLLYGGKTLNNCISHEWLLWRETIGWVQLQVTGSDIKARFGAAMSSTSAATGLLVGGMGSESTILFDAFEWSVEVRDEAPFMVLRKVQIRCQNSIHFDSPATDPAPGLEDNDDPSCVMVGRIGAALVHLPEGLLLIGGVASETMAEALELVVLAKSRTHQNGQCLWQPSAVSVENRLHRPLLIGHCAQVYDNKVVILGGGALCFSFGSHWNMNVLTISPCNRFEDPSTPIGLLNVDLRKPIVQAASLSFQGDSLHSTARQSVMDESVQHFERTIEHDKPAKFTNVDLGPCVTDWTLDTLIDRVGADREVSH